MITKYQMISALAEDTARQVAKNGQEWTSYLTTAARLYKYPFHEQIPVFPKGLVVFFGLCYNICPKTGCNSLCFA